MLRPDQTDHHETRHRGRGDLRFVDPRSHIRRRRHLLLEHRVRKELPEQAVHNRRPDGGFVFVCDPGVADPVQWYRLGCLEHDSNAIDLYKWDRAATKASCTALGGRDCGAYVTSSKRSLDEEVRKDWAKRCTANGKGAEMRIPEIKLMADEKAATNYCK